MLGVVGRGGGGYAGRGEVGPPGRGVDGLAAPEGAAGFAAAGGAYFLARCHALVRRPGRMPARRAFLASLVQLSAVLLGAMADVALL